MNHIKDIFLMNIFELSLSEKEILAFIFAHDFEPISLIKAYDFSIDKKFFSVTRALLKTEALTKEFSFLGNTLNHFLQSEEFPKIKPLYFKRLDPSYEGVLQEIFKTSQITG